jgi:carboxypeptidase PM20D1
MDGGHSSMPAAESAIGVLARAVARLEATPPPARVAGVAERMFEILGKEMEGPGRWVTANLWLLRPLLLRSLLGSPSAAAMLRTTVAPTLLQAGVKDNVLARRAGATVNLRLLPGDTVAAALHRLRATIADDRVLLAVRPGALEASPVSTLEGDGYAALDRAIRGVFPAAAVAPGLMIGATDARHWAAFSDRVYRFAPLHLRPDDLARFHGADERLAIEGLVDAIDFYERLLDDLAF